MISGKCFSELCRWVIDPRYPDREPFQYAKAQSGDWVFVNGDYLSRVREQIPVLFTKRFVFIVHNTDRSFGEYEVEQYMKYASHIYAINTTTTHPRLTTIPLGFVDRQLPFLETFQVPNVPRDIDIYMNFTRGTNMEKRNQCLEMFENNPRVTQRTRLSVSEYYDDLCRSKFVLCPEGTGIDTHRVYEALFCGATPVVLRNSLSRLYEKMPVCIVNSWSDPFYEPKEKSFNTGVFKFVPITKTFSVQREYQLE